MISLNNVTFYSGARRTHCSSFSHHFPALLFGWC